MHRTATFYDLRITAHGITRAEGYEVDFETDPKSLLEIADQIIFLKNSGDQIIKKGRSDKAAKYYLADARIEDGRFIMLINRSDPAAPDAVSTDPDSKSRLVHVKPPGHGGDFSAHVVFDLAPVLGDNYYLCVIETIYGSGLHVSSIGDYLRFVVRHLKKQFPDDYSIPHNSGALNAQGKPVLVHHIHLLELQGHPSDEFEKDLDGGTLSLIELLSFSKEGAVWDEKGGIVERKRSVELRPQQDLLGDISSAVRQVRNKMVNVGEEYKHIRIRFRNQAGEPKDATIASDSGKLVNSDKYVKRHYVDAPLVNTASFDVVNNFILKEVIKLME